jgi:hypothetical protein
VRIGLFRLSVLLLAAFVGASAVAQVNEITTPHGKFELPLLNPHPSHPIPESLQSRNVPATRRDLAYFSLFDSRNTMMDVVRKCGTPDYDAGSGLYVFIYNLEDGSRIAVSTADLKRLAAIGHLTVDGRTELLEKAGVAEDLRNCRVKH